MICHVLMDVRHVSAHVGLRLPQGRCGDTCTGRKCPPPTCAALGDLCLLNAPRRKRCCGIDGGKGYYVCEQVRTYRAGARGNLQGAADLQGWDAKGWLHVTVYLLRKCGLSWSMANAGPHRPRGCHPGPLLQGRGGPQGLMSCGRPGRGRSRVVGSCRNPRPSAPQP